MKQLVDKELQTRSLYFELKMIKYNFHCFIAPFHLYLLLPLNLIVLQHSTINFKYIYNFQNSLIIKVRSVNVEIVKGKN